MSGKSGESKQDKSQEKIGIFQKKSQETWYKHALNKKVYHH